MGIQNFPLSLQPIIQQGFLEREFEQALVSRLGYRAIADREPFAVGIGETLTKTRAGLKPSVTVPLAPNTNTNLDNGLTPSTWGVEQYTITINHYASTTDLNMVTSSVGIASQFLQNAYTNGEQAARSLDETRPQRLLQPLFRRQHPRPHHPRRRRPGCRRRRHPRLSDRLRQRHPDRRRQLAGPGRHRRRQRLHPGGRHRRHHQRVHRTQRRLRHPHLLNQRHRG